MKKFINSIIFFALLFFINNISVFAEDYCVYQLQHVRNDKGNYGYIHYATFVAKWEGKSFVFVNYIPNGINSEENEITKYIYDSLISNSDVSSYDYCDGSWNGCSVFYPDIEYSDVSTDGKNAYFRFLKGIGNDSTEINATATLTVTSGYTSECPGLHYNINYIDTENKRATIEIKDDNDNLGYFNSNDNNVITLISGKTLGGATSDDPSTGNVNSLTCDKVPLNFGTEAIDQTGIGNFSIQFKKDTDDSWYMFVNGTNLDTTYFQETNEFNKSLEVQFDEYTLIEGTGYGCDTKNNRCIITLGSSNYKVIIEKDAWEEIMEASSNSCPTYYANLYVNQYSTYFLIEKDYRKPTDKDFFEDISFNYEFPELFKSFINPLKAYKKDVVLYEYKIKINGELHHLSEIHATDDICYESKCTIDDYNSIVKEILDYCSTTNINKLKSEYEYIETDCASFVQLLNDLDPEWFSGCDILTSGFKDKLNLYLNIFKIAAPILAVVLGMLDFTKVLVAGDADKEMKDAWRKFKVRLIAAAILFIVPVMLSTLINLFIGDKINNNPYCDLFDTLDN